MFKSFNVVETIENLLEPKDFTANLSQFGVKSNILWITGFSGSGKTYLSNMIKKAFCTDDECYIISLDDFCEIEENHLENLYDKYPWLVDRVLNEVTGIQYSVDIKDYVSKVNIFIDKLKQCTKEDFWKRFYIIEGLQLYDQVEYNQIKDCPIIIKRVNFLTCLVRRWNRKKTKEIMRSRTIIENIQSLVEYWNWYKFSNKKINELKNNIKKVCWSDFD